MKKLVMLGVALGGAGIAAVPALADDPSAPPAAPASTAMTTPSMAGPLAANPNPFKFDAGFAGPIYATGQIVGLALFQGNPVAGDKNALPDLSNIQVELQKTDGPFQFYVQAGAYSLPSLGSLYLRATDANRQFFGPLPVAYAKIAPTGTFSVQAGKLPTLFGAEYTFTFQNMNIERGLLWNQEPAISKGVQANLTVGPVAYSLSVNDGYHSGRYNWIDGSASWTIDPANTIEVAGGGNFGQTPFLTDQFATPIAQSNSRIVDLIYTYSAAPWTITPYFQYTSVPKNLSVGIPGDGSTYGGAILANYSIDDNWNLAGRAEIIGSTGSTTNLLYGPGSMAYSLTVTPTYQSGVFFARAEGSIVKADSITPGDAFGKSGSRTSQGRLMFEAGVLF